MKQIKLSNYNFFAIVDDEDFDFLSKFSWCLHHSKKCTYAIARVGNKPIFMHQLLLPLNAPFTVDHKNNNGLDNRKLNLRPATRSQQTANTRKRIGCSSKYKGVAWIKENSHWQATIRVNGKGKNLGAFTHEVNAAKAYNEAATKYFGEFAVLNEFNLEDIK